MKIVTAGEKYVDIDAYAGCIAYATLLRKQGHQAHAVLSGTLNQSIPEMVMAWDVDTVSNYRPSEDDEFILVDVSEPEYFASFVDHNRISEVIDHRPGYGEYWQNIIGSGADIEDVGAACTQIFERWQKSDMLHEMDSVAAKLLICGILDNTLNFGAKITSERDRVAFAQLSQIASWTEHQTAQYFQECQAAITEALVHAIRNDEKTMSLHAFDTPISVGQLVVWDAADIIADSIQVIVDTMSNLHPEWFLNLVDISRKKSYFVSTDAAIKMKLERLLDIKFQGDTAESNRLWLRKEILQRDIERQP